MSTHGTFQGPTERDAVRAACQSLLAEPKMLEYTVLELKEPTKTRYRTTQGHCSIEVTGINRKPAPNRPKQEATSNPEQEERAPRSRSRDNRGDRDNRRGRDNRGDRKGQRRPEKPMDPEMMAISAERAENLVRNWLDSMGFGEFGLDVEENAQRVFVRVQCERDELMDGDEDVLRSLQYLANAAINWKLRGKKIVVERATAREDRETALRELSLEMAQKVIDSGEEVTLQPMHAGDRRFVHQTLTDVSGVKTQSEGSGGFRCIRILPE